MAWYKLEALIELARSVHQNLPAPLKAGCRVKSKALFGSPDCLRSFKVFGGILVSIEDESESNALR